MTMAKQYYVRDDQGKVRGPFSDSDLQRFAHAGKILPSFYISKDREKWIAAAKVQNLFAHVEQALSESLPSSSQYRTLTRKEQIALFVDRFVLSNEQFKDTGPFILKIRIWWAKLTFPSHGFVIAEVTPTGVHHVKYDPATEIASEIDQQEVENRISAGIKQTNWFKIFFFTIVLIWAIWSVKDLIFGFSLTAGTFKTALVGMMAVCGYVYKNKRTKVFVGYVLDRAATAKLEEVKAAFAILKKCSRVWLYQVRAHRDQRQWKYHAGNLFTVSKLPVAVFNRPIPNVEINISVSGITYQDRALYFLLEMILVIDGSSVRYVDYEDLKVETDTIEYVEAEGHVYADSQVIDHRWKFINKDGSRDKRFKENIELPVVRCGLLKIEAKNMKLELMTNNPEAPILFKRRLPILRTVK
jgi:hypothetical protein